MQRHFFPLLAALCALAASAWSQTTEAVPLKNWQAPLAWQPTSADEVATAKEASNARGESPAVTTPGSSTLLGVLVAITPCRLVDTRQNWATPFGGGASAPLAWAAGSTTTIPAPSGSCSLPAALAYSANVTVIPSGKDVRWLTAFPTGATMPTIATLTGYEGGTVSNAAIIPANSSGSFEVYVKDATEVVIDVNGYYVSPSALALGAGTASAPSLTFSNDTNTGLYSSSAGTVEVTSSGSNILTVNSGGISVNGTIDNSSCTKGWCITTPTALAQTSHDSWTALRGYSTGGGSTTGVNGEVASATGIGGQFLNDATTGLALQAEVSGTPVMNVDQNGVHAGPGMTGTPFAYGNFNTDGSMNAGSSNIACTAQSNSGYYYDCTIPGFDYTTWVAVATGINVSQHPIIVITSTGGVNVLRVRVFDLYSGTPTEVQNSFSVVVFKP
jgi:hypothetical protein